MRQEKQRSEGDDNVQIRTIIYDLKRTHFGPARAILNEQTETGEMMTYNTTLYISRSKNIKGNIKLIKLAKFVLEIERPLHTFFCIQKTHSSWE